MHLVIYNQERDGVKDAKDLLYRGDAVEEAISAMAKNVAQAVGGVLTAIMASASAYALFQIRHISLDASWRQFKVGGVWTGIALLVILSVAGMINFGSACKKIANPKGLIEQMKKESRVFVVMQSCY